MKPILWRLTVEPIAPPETTEGGIALPEDVLEANERMSCIGKVLDLGALAFKAKPRPGLDYEQEERSPKVGDYVMYGRHSGQFVEFKSGRKLVILNDTDVLAVCESATEALEVRPYV